MSQCHDPYDVIELPTRNEIAKNWAPGAAQCHDSYESVELTTAPTAVIAATTVTVHKTAAVKNKARSGRRIVVGVDGSGASRDALRWAAHQAQLTGASLEAVISWEIAPSFYPVPVPSGYDPASNAKTALDQTLDSVIGERNGLKIVPSVVQGPAAPTLLRAAHGADLLVVGSRGHGPLLGMLLGSVSEQCMAHASCPVVVVHERYPAA
ncbi:MAG: universal stress protein [Acidimicrobiales bacterium]|jgi:nucleotide-binding universal stress UspA family protein